MHYIHHQHIQPCTPHTRAPARSSRAAGGTLPLRFTGGCTSAIRPHSVRRSWGLPPGALTSVLHAKRHRAEAHGGDAHVARAKLFREERLGLALGVGRGHGHGARPTSQAQATQGGGGQERPHGHERRRGRRERQHPEAPAHRAAVYCCIVSGSCRIKHEICRTHRTAVAHGCATRRMAETQRMCAWWPRPCAALGMRSTALHLVNRFLSPRTLARGASRTRREKHAPARVRVCLRAGRWAKRSFLAFFHPLHVPLRCAVPRFARLFVARILWVDGGSAGLGCLGSCLGSCSTMNICGGFAPGGVPARDASCRAVRSLTCVCLLPAFPFPRTKPFDFARFPRKEPDAEQKLEQAKALRAELAEALNEGNSAKVAEAADAYLPLAVGVWRAMEQGSCPCVCARRRQAPSTPATSGKTQTLARARARARTQGRQRTGGRSALGCRLNGRASRTASPKSFSRCTPCATRS